MTAAGLQPSQWVTNVLRGYKNPSVEQALNILAGAARDTFAARLGDLSVDGNVAHCFLIAAHVDKAPRLYSIDLLRHPSGDVDFRYTMHVNARGVPHRVAATGSGALFLRAFSPHGRRLLRAISAVEDGRLTPHLAAEQFAAVNVEVARNVTSVGPGCMVLWRFMDEGGGGQRIFGPSEAPQGMFEDLIPGVAGGIPIHELLRATGPTVVAHLEAMLRGENVGELDGDLMQKLVNPIKDTPDNKI